MKKVRWEEMFPDELDAALAENPLVYLTYGLCEPHGLHSAIGLDELKAHELAVKTALVHGGVVAPPFFWHVHETGYHAAFGDATIGNHNPWLTDLPPWVFFKVYLYQLRAVAARGFHAAIVITGHYGGNEHDLKRIAEIFMRHSPLRVWAGADHEAIHFEDFAGDHAGRCETSQLWALRPDLVDPSRLAPGEPDEIARVMATGPDASSASRRSGEGIVASQVEWLGRKARELLAAYGSTPMPSSRTPGNPLGPLTFDEVERLWRTDVEPIIGELISMRTRAGEDLVGPESPWYANQQSALYPAHPPHTIPAIPRRGP